MLQKANKCEPIEGLGNDLIDGGVISMQYTDDTFLFMAKNEDYAKNLKWILSCFELMCGMRINYHKSELVPVNIEQKSSI
jgi:hypothetical protein